MPWKGGESVGNGEYVAVVGGANVDIWGRSFAGLIPRDSNPGEVRSSFGGVGRNIAHNLRLLGVPVGMLAALGEDAWGAELRKSCAVLGIDLRHALTVPEARTGSYLYLSGPDGDMALAVCDALITERIGPAEIRERLDWLNGAAAVVLDGNLSEAAIEALTEGCARPIFADPVSSAKARRLRPFLARIHSFKPNCLEAEALTGEREPLEAARALVELGVAHAFVSDGPRGMAVADRGGKASFVPCARAALRNATGGGDACMAALVRAWLDGRSSAEAARFALAAGAVAVESPETISPAMSLAAVLERMQER